VDISVTVCLFVLVCVCVFLFVCLFVCTFTDLSAEDKASGVKFCMAVHQRPRQGILYFWGNFAPPKALNRTNRTASARSTSGHAHGMCGYTAVPEDGRT